MGHDGFFGFGDLCELRARKIQCEVFVLKFGWKKFTLHTIILNTIFFAIIFSTCEFGSPLYLYGGTPVDSRSRKIKILQIQDIPKFERNSAKYSFLILTDTHFGTEKIERREKEFLQKFESLFSAQDELKPRFIINLGDTLNAGRDNEADSFNEASKTWCEKAKEISDTDDFKIYSILGNHDLYNKGWQIWKEKIWPGISYYKFFLDADSDGKGFWFYFLDSANGTLGASQLEDLEKNLEADSAAKIIFCHYPPFVEQNGQYHFAFGNTIERNKMIAIFARHNVKFIFAGHTHEYSEHNFNKFVEVVVPSYAFKKAFALVTIDEASEKVEYKIVEY